MLARAAKVLTNKNREHLYAFREQYHEPAHPQKHLQAKKSDEGSRGTSFPIQGLNRLLKHAGMPYPGWVLLALSLLSGTLFGSLFYFVHLLLIPVFFIIGAYFPIYFCLEKAKHRAEQFSDELPVLLLATSSNMKAGLTVYSSLERATLLLPDKSEVRGEVQDFLARVTQGVPKDKAIALFGSTIAVPELDLLRSAFALVITHGGRFSRTLERLAKVSRDRKNLICASRVSTASMRMTANVLIVLTPIMMGILSIRTKDYFDVLLTNSIASTLGCIGALTICASVFTLRRMSDFKP